MTDAQRKEVDRMLEEGRHVTQGVLPDLDPVAAFYARTWTELRGSTHGEHPISISAIKVFADAAGMSLFELLPPMQTMDGTLFAAQARRLEAERKKREAKAKSRGRASRGRRR